MKAERPPVVVGRIVFYEGGKPVGSEVAHDTDLGCSKSAHIFVKGAKKCFCGREVLQPEAPRGEG